MTFEWVLALTVLVALPAWFWWSVAAPATRDVRRRLSELPPSGDPVMQMRRDTLGQGPFRMLAAELLSWRSVAVVLGGIAVIFLLDRVHGGDWDWRRQPWWVLFVPVFQFAQIESMRKWNELREAVVGRESEVGEPGRQSL